MPLSSPSTLHSTTPPFHPIPKHNWQPKYLWSDATAQQGKKTRPLGLRESCSRKQGLRSKSLLSSQILLPRPGKCKLHSSRCSPQSVLNPLHQEQPQHAIEFDRGEKSVELHKESPSRTTAPDSGQIIFHIDERDNGKTRADVCKISWVFHLWAKILFYIFQWLGKQWLGKEK